MPKKSNVKILDEADLVDIRKRLGAKTGRDKSRDPQINAMTAEGLVAAKCGWEIGDEWWAESYIEMYRRLVAAGVTTNPLDED